MPTVAQNSYSVTTGQPVTLVCTVSSILPVTSVYWQSNIGGITTTITSSTNTAKYSGSTVANPSLTISSASSSDAGSYTCFATNSVGTGQSGATALSVTGSKYNIYMESHILSWWFFFLKWWRFMRYGSFHWKMYLLTIWLVETMS